MVVSAPSPLSSINIGILQPGRPTSHTWTNSDSGAKGALSVAQPNLATWVATVGGSTPPQGGYTLSLQVIGVAATTTTWAIYQATGSLWATLLGADGTLARGSEVVVTATF